MLKVKKYIELNEQQFNIMRQAISRESYEWEQAHLEKRLLGILPTERRWYDEFREDVTKDKLQQNQIVDEINKCVNKYNHNITTTTKDIFNEIKSKYNELYSFGTIKSFYTFESDIENEIIFNKVFLITGIGGMGKSQYLYEFQKKLKEKNYKHLSVYGKYCNSLDDVILDEVIQETKNEKFYFIVDAINEFNSTIRNKILKFVEDTKNNENLRVIISYRTHSLSSSEYKKIKSITTIEETFLGVSSYDALEKISEKYNVDLSIFENMLENNNPYQLKLIVKFISNNMLITDMKKPLEKGTYIYENMIKEALNRDRWLQSKKVVEEIVRIKDKRIPLHSIYTILGSEAQDYIKEMKNTAFADTYNYDGKDYFVFLNESLLDYLIARNFFDSIKDSDEQSLIDLMNEAIKDFYSVGEALILMIFEKFDENIGEALHIINNSNLKSFLKLTTFNELSLSKTNQLYVSKIMQPDMEISEILLKAGGQHTNPFNCCNYLNKTLFFKKNLISTFKYYNYEIAIIRNKLKVWSRSIAKHNYDTLYLDEKFWFAFWISSLPNGKIRFLARKLLFEITKSNNKYINILIRAYYKITDDYIKEGIIHVLSSLKKNNPQIIPFFNKINTPDMININNMYFISTYLYGKEIYIDFEKEDVLISKDKNFNNKIFDFFCSVDFAFKEEYRMFGLNVYHLNKKNIYFQDKFLKCPKQIISHVNQKLSSTLECIVDECPAYDILKDFSKILYRNIPKEELLPKDIYLAWQSQFKKLMKKYNIKSDDLDKRVYETDEKTNIYKILELSISNTIGSIASNYYTTDFWEYSQIGYSQYLHNFYQEQASLYYPISVYNEDIDRLNNKIIKKINIPFEKNEKWANNGSLSIDNLRKIIEPVTYKNEQWRLIYGSIKRKETNSNDRFLVWSDDYILNLAVDETHSLCNNSEIDRKYTIENPTLYDSLDNVNLYNFTRTFSVKNSSEYNDVFVQTDFNVPPTAILKLFELSFYKYNNSWINPDGEEIILVNNNKGTWYDDGITGSIYIKEKYFQQLQKKHDIKYFAYTERFWGENGYRNSAAMEIELFLDNTERHYNHYEASENHKIIIPKHCLKCAFYKEHFKQEEKWKNYNYEVIIKNILEE